MGLALRATGRPSRARRAAPRLSLVDKRQATLREFYEELHRIADALAPAVRRAFLKAIKDAKRSPPTLVEIREAVERRSVSDVMTALDLGPKLARSLEPMGEALRRVFEDSARATIAQLPPVKPPPTAGLGIPGGRRTPTAGLEASLDLLNQRSVDWLRRYRLGLISPVSIDRLGRDVRIVPATLDGIREVIVDAFERGGHPFEQARTIRNMIGLNARQAKALDNFRGMLIEEGMKSDVIAKRVDRYYTRLLNARAKTISRTETIRASNAGQQEAWEQAAEQGFLDRAIVRRKWIVTPDDRLCPICRAIPGMNPDGAPLNNPFATPVGPRIAPPAHPNCRCATGLMRERV